MTIETVWKGNNATMRKKMALPPGPPEPAIVGSLRSFGKKPLVFFQSLVPYGDIASFHLLHTPCYFVNRPEYVKQVLQEHNQHYGKQTTDFKVFRNVLGNGLFTSEGAFWLRQRRLMQPAFHRKQLEQFGQLMTQAIERLMVRWEQRQEEGLLVLDVWQEMRRLTLCIVGEVLFGIDPSQDAIGQHFAALERYIMDLFQCPLVLPPLDTNITESLPHAGATRADRHDHAYDCRPTAAEKRRR